MFKKIDCVLIKVTNPFEVAEFYKTTFGLIPLWKDEESIGLKFIESDAEIVLHKNNNIPDKLDVNYLVDSVEKSLELLIKNNCKLLVGPFDIPIGKCAVFMDPFGVQHTILDVSKGLRVNNYVDAKVEKI